LAEAAAGIAADDFAAHMSSYSRTGGPQPVAAPAEGTGLSNEPAASDGGDDVVRERQIEPSARDPKVPCGVPAPGARADEIGMTAGVAGRKMPSIASSGDGQASAIAPDVRDVHERVEANAKGGPDAGEPETPVVATAPGAERPIPVPLPEQPIPTPSPTHLLQPLDAPAAEARPGDPAQTPEPQADRASSGDGAAGTAPAIAAGIGFAIARQAPPRALEAATAAGAPGPAEAPVLPDDASTAAPSGATGPRQENLTPTGGAQSGRAFDPERALARGEGVDGDDRGRQEIAAALDDPSGSQVRATDSSARQQSSGDIQPGRLPQISGLHGNAVAGPHSATGLNGEVVQTIARAPDGAVSVEPGRPPATQQVALQITRALDQGRTEIRIRLDPPELGEVDIQLEFRDLRLTASVSAERSDTLDLLQRDSRALTRALREAGLELADSDLSFAHSGRNDRPDTGTYTQREIHLPHPLAAAAPLQDRPPALVSPGGFVSLGDGRMDLRV
jgi:hypothetical protein